MLGQKCHQYRGLNGYMWECNCSLTRPPRVPNDMVVDHNANLQSPQRDWSSWSGQGVGQRATEPTVGGGGRSLGGRGVTNMHPALNQ